MRTVIVSTLLLSLMPSGLAAQSPSRRLRYERPLSLPQGASGQACAVLDGAFFAHTAATGSGDVRIFGRNQGNEFEVPFALVESAPVTQETQDAALRNVAVHNDWLNFDLEMAGEYSEVDLDVDAKNFVGIARVAGRDGEGRSTPLGSFTIFDLSSQGLARSTALLLPASSYPILHVELRLTDSAGETLPVSAATIRGATVPPDRGLYTTIASAAQIEQQGKWSIATMIVPAHVPVERALFVVKPEFDKNFFRDVTVTATPMQGGLAALGAAEGVSGHIYRVVRDASGSMPPIDSSELAIDTVVGANLRAPAKITASIDNAQDRPLPIERVDLQMYQRRLCFQARSGLSYALFYGDAGLSAPSYGYARKFVLTAAPISAALGPEQPNPGYISRSAEHNDGKPGRDLPWLLAMAAIVTAGVTALQFMRHRQ